MLNNQVCVITGASKGLGKSVAHLFARNHARLILAARTADDVEEVAQSIRATGGEVTAVAADVSDYLQVRRLFQKVDELYGQVDILLNSAGVGLFGPLQNFNEDEIVRTINVNLIGTILCSREAFTRMQQAGHGHIVNIVSTSGKAARALESVYCASKWGVAGFTESLQLEGRQAGIKATAFCPGGMRTSFWDAFRHHQPDTSRFLDPDAVALVLLNVVMSPQALSVDEAIVRRM